MSSKNYEYNKAVKIDTIKELMDLAEKEDGDKIAFEYRNEKDKERRLIKTYTEIVEIEDGDIKNENQKENMDSDFREHNAGDGGRKILYGAKLTGTSDSDSKGDYGRLWSFLEDSTGGER